MNIRLIYNNNDKYYLAIYCEDLIIILDLIIKTTNNNHRKNIKNLLRYIKESNKSYSILIEFKNFQSRKIYVEEEITKKNRTNTVKLEVFEKLESNNNPQTRGYQITNNFQYITNEEKYLIIEEINQEPILNRLKILITANKNTIIELKYFKYKYTPQKYSIQIEFSSETILNEFLKKYQKYLNNLIIQSKKQDMTPYFSSKGYKETKNVN